MQRAFKPDHKLDIGPLPSPNMTQIRSAASAGADSPDFASGTSPRFQLANALAAAGQAQQPNRPSNPSPSKEYTGSRLFPKRAREIQAQAGVSPQVWRPPPTGSGHSTPLRETIPESPVNNDFPDFNQSPTQPLSQSASATDVPARRSRAGTVPSRFPPDKNIALDGFGAFSRSSQPSPATTPMETNPPPSTSLPNHSAPALSPATTSSLLSRLRAGSMPQRSALLTNLTPLGPSYFSSGWSTPRSRATTLQGAQSARLPPSSGHFSRESFADNDVKTLDYLGLVDAPHPGKDTDTASGNPLVAQLAALNDLKKNVNRLRSYSVNAKERYDNYDDIDDPAHDRDDNPYLPSQGQYAHATAVAHASAVQEAVRQHNLDVQVFTQLANANRPRARTAGMLDSPSSRMMRNYLPTPSRLDNSISASELENANSLSPDALSNAVHNLHIDVNTGDYDMLDESPSRALWLGNIPSSTTVSSLNALFEGYGPIESARVLTHKSCGFINFENIESAMLAKSQMCNKELFPGAGPIRIGFAKVPSGSATPGANFDSPSPDALGRSSATFVSPGGALRTNASINAETAAAALETPKMRDLRTELRAMIRELGASDDELVRVMSNVEQAISYDLYHTEPPVPTEPSPHRAHDAPRLRDIRKRLDNNNCTREVAESIAFEMLPEIAELSSDYLGNTVVQKLFEICSEQTKEAMLQAISPRLAEIGMHKNGTWAAQKIIDVAHTPAQMTMIVDALRPHAVQLFLDQYGNYVMQCCLRFGPPANGFIFDVMLQRLWESAQGRFGARAMRACLESHYSSKDQQRMLAAAIALHGVQLATNANGALLLTWFLDTCTFPHRRAILAPRLVSHIVHLCTHKVAYLTVLKLINQRSEPEARDLIVRALFFSTDSNVLEDILSDQSCGATFVYKVLSTPFLNDKMRPETIENVRNVLVRLNAQPQQGYKRLMDEVGLSTRNGATPKSRDQSSTRSVSRNRVPSGYVPTLEQQQQYSDYAYTNLMGQAGLDAGQIPRPGSYDSSTSMDPFVHGNLATPSYTHSPSLTGLPPLTPQQIQYQQAILAQQHAAVHAQRAGGYLASPSPLMTGYRTASPSHDAFGRPPSMTGSPVPGPHHGSSIPGGFQQAGYSPMMAVGGYQYPVGHFPQQQPQQGQAGSQRRGRVNGPVNR